MSGLALNDQSDHFKEFYGRNNEQMPRLVAEGRTPLSVAELMRRRLEVLADSSDDVKSAWWDNYFDTGDGVFYHPEGNIKIVLAAQPIRDMTVDTSLSYGALMLNKDREASIAAYNALDGAEFSRSELEKHVGNFLSKDEAKNHPVWKLLAGGDQALLNTYVDAAFAEIERRFGNEQIMDVHISSPLDVAAGRLWLIGTFRSAAMGLNDVGYSDGRLIGVASGALS
jgi:hypothetical protein